jgi:hypothetical protein
MVGRARVLATQEALSFTKFAQGIVPQNIYSQFGEDGVVKAIFEKIGTTNKYCVEFGINNGIFFSNTRRLIAQDGWSGLWIEGSPEMASMAIEGSAFLNVKILNRMVEVEGPNSLDAILDEVQAPLEPDLLSIDVDGQDFYIWNSLMRYRPRVVICEFDPLAHPNFIPEIGGPGQASELMIHNICVSRGYQPVAKTAVNLICVRNDLCHLVGEIVEAPSPLDALGAMRPVKMEGQVPAEAPGLLGGYTEEEFIKAKARRFREGNFMLAACMSTPRWGPLSTMDVILSTVSLWSVPYFRSEGAYWHHQLTTAIEDALKVHPDAIVTFDYDSLFCPAPTDNDIAKLVTLLIENPDVDIIAPMQLQREGGFLIANSDSGELTITDPLTPVWFAHFGATVFRASVFEKIAKPWFWEKPDPNGGWRDGRIDPDTGFWLNCKENGIKVCYAMDVLLGHGEYGPTFPDDQFKPIRVSLNEWRKNGMKPPANAFNRQRVIQAALAGTYPTAKVHKAGQ